MRQLAPWLTRHLNDPQLLLWFVKRGGQLHENLARLIERRLDVLNEFERTKNITELDRISSGAPNAIPSLLMHKLWRLLLSGRVKSWSCDLNCHRWSNLFRQTGLNAILRFELRDILTPRVLLSEPYRSREGGEQFKPERIRDLVEWEIVLSGNYIRSSLPDPQENKPWAAVLPELLSDFTGLLRDAFDL